MPPAFFLRWRPRGVLLFVALVVLSVSGLVIGRKSELRRKVQVKYNLYVADGGLWGAQSGPPKYAALRRWQAALPQHNLALPFPEGKTGRYVKFSNEANWIGWNNCFNER